MNYIDNVFKLEELREIDKFLQRGQEVTTKNNGKYRGFIFTDNDKEFAWITEHVYNKIKNFIPGKFIGVTTWNIVKPFNFHVDENNKLFFNLEGKLINILIPLSTDFNVDKVGLAATLFKTEHNIITRVDWKQGRVIYFDSSETHGSAPFEGYENKQYMFAQVAQLE